MRGARADGLHGGPRGDGERCELRLGEPGGSTTGAPPIDPPSPGSSTTLADDTSGSSSADTTGGGFLGDPDLGGGSFECSILTQDCPRGFKCNAWANDGGGAWNAAKCVPIVEDPAEVGEPCHVEGSRTSGIDDCVLGAMCFDVDPETGMGTCVAYCLGPEEDLHCEDPWEYCAITGDGAIVLCLPMCDPIDQNCPEGQACYPIQDNWSCAPDASGELGAYGDPCEFINVCDPGLICLGAAVVPAGQACEGSPGCCTEICDISDPTDDLQCAGAAEGQTCQAWFEEGAAPAILEDVGVCALPL